jgi:hypothetical protein
MRNITLSADERLIDAARERARAELTTLNAAFRNWLATYAREAEEASIDTTLSMLRGRMTVGRRLTRDEMNER